MSFLNPFTGDLQRGTPGSGSGGGDADTLDGFDSDEFLLLAGRAGGANNPLISTDAQGIITGCGASGGGGLGLDAASGSTRQFGDFIWLNPSMTTVSTDGGPLVATMVLAQSLDLDTSSGTPLVWYGQLVGIGATWTISDPLGTGGFRAHLPFAFGPTIRNTPSEPTGLLGYMAMNLIEPMLVADGAACTAGYEDVGLVLMQNGIDFRTENGGSLTVDRIGLAVHAPTGDAGVHIIANIGYEHRTPFGVLNDVADKDIAFLANDENAALFPDVRSSVYSNGDDRWMLHRGAVLIGEDFFSGTPAPASVSAGIEISSPTRALLLSRMTTTARDALTAVNGMLLYNSTDDKFQGYEAGAWVNLV